MIMKKTIWVTGASKGIGQALANKFIKEDWNVAATSRSINTDNEQGNNCFPLRCDVSSEQEVNETAEKITGKFGGIDVLINNAGIAVFKPVSVLSLEDFKRQIDVNLIGTFLCSKAVIPLMKEKKQGIILNVISVSGIKTYPFNGAYGASKAGALMLSRVMREELKNDNIKVISVIPGPTLSEIWNPKVLDKYSDKMMKPEDVADVIYSAVMQPADIITEEIVLRPITGDLSL
jgi:short-subunit dehydrogenase